MKNWECICMYDYECHYEHSKFEWIKVVGSLTCTVLSTLTHSFYHSHPVVKWQPLYFTLYLQIVLSSISVLAQWHQEYHVLLLILVLHDLCDPNITLHASVHLVFLYGCVRTYSLLLLLETHVWELLLHRWQPLVCPEHYHISTKHFKWYSC